MKKISILIILILFTSGFKNYIDDLFIMSLKNSPKYYDDTAINILKKNFNNAVKKYGYDGIRVFNSNGISITETAVKYGNDVWDICIRNPQYSKLLLSKTDDLLPLVRQYGDDILKLESKSAGISKKVIENFGANNIKYIAGKNSDEILKLVSYANRTDKSSTKELLLKKFTENGSSFFNNIDSKKVLTYGLTASMIIAATNTSLGVKNGIESIGTGIKDITEKEPKLGKNLISDLAKPFTIPISFFLFALAFIVIIWVFVKLKILNLFRTKNKE